MCCVRVGGRNHRQNLVQDIYELCLLSLLFELNKLSSVLKIDV